MIKRIMIYLANGLGDVVFSIPAILELRRLFPESEICAFGWPENIDLIRSHDFADVFVPVPRPQSLVRFLLSHPAMLFPRFDLSFTFRGNPGRLLLFKKIMLIRHIYSVKTTNDYPFDHYIEFDPLKSMARQDMDTLKLAGLATQERKIDLLLSDSELQFGKEYWNNLHVLPKTPVLIHPSWTDCGAIKALPYELTCTLYWELRKIGIPVYLLLGPVEMQFLDFTKLKKIPLKNMIVERIAMRKLAAIMSQTRFVITADSGPGHIADASGTRVVSIWGPTSSETVAMANNQRFQILSDYPCRQCYDRKFFMQTCKIGRPCMEAHSPERIFDFIMHKIKENEL